LLRVVQFHKRMQPQPDGFAMKRVQSIAGQAFRDEQYGIGAGVPRFEQLITVKNEIFPQYRQFHCCFHVGEIL